MAQSSLPPLGWKSHPLLLQLKETDEKISSQCFLAANQCSPLATWRSSMILLEYSAHGIPWLLMNILLIWFVTDRELEAFYVNLFVEIITSLFFWLLFPALEYTAVSSEIRFPFAALCADILAVACVKSVARRRRPPANHNDMFFAVSVDHLSFPSGHASRAAMLASIFALRTSVFLPLKLVLVTWCTAVAASRVLLGRHYVGDVLGGIVLGFFEYLALTTLFWMSTDSALYLASFFTTFDTFHVGKEGVEL